MSKDQHETRLDQMLRRAKNRRSIAVLLFSGLLVVALGQVTGALDNIFSFAEKRFMQEKPSEQEDSLEGRDRTSSKEHSERRPERKLKVDTSASTSGIEAPKETTRNPDSSEEEPRLEVYGIQVEGGPDPQARPFLTPLVDDSTIGSSHTIFLEEDWKQLLSYVNEISSQYNKSWPCEGCQIPEEARHAVIEKADQFKRGYLLPAVLVFVLENTAGSRGRKAVLQNLYLKFNPKQAGVSSLDDQALVLWEDYLPTFADLLPPTRGRVLLDGDKIEHRIRFEGPSTESPMFLFRKELEPGDVSFFYIEIDSELIGEIDLRLDLVVEYSYVSNSATEYRQAEFPGFINERVVRPREGQVKQVYVGVLDLPGELIRSDTDSLEELLGRSGKPERAPTQGTSN